MTSRPLAKTDIERLLRELDAELATQRTRGELYLVGGAVMCLVHEARPATRDLDGFFRPSRQLRAAAARIAERNELSQTWLNDAVKGFLSDHGTFNTYLELEHLTVYAADPEYLLAMKCLAARIGAEFHDLDDIRYLLRYLNITDAAAAKVVIARYYPLEKFPQKTLYVLDELLGSA